MALFRKKAIVSPETESQTLAVTKRIMESEGLTGDPVLDASFVEDGLGFDSMGVLQLLHALEKELDLDIPEAYWGTKRFTNLRHLLETSLRSRSQTARRE